MRARIVAGLVLIGAVALAACGSSGTTTTTSGGPVHPPPGGVGTYVRTSSRGTTALALTANGHYTQSFRGNPDAIQGTWTYGGGKITFTETGGNSAACVGTPGTYTWEFKAGNLNLGPSSDPCKQRSGDFRLGPFTKRA